MSPSSESLRTLARSLFLVAEVMISLSNLLKQYFVMPPQPEDKLVIDSNKLAEKRIRESIRRDSGQEPVPAEDGFTAGLDAPEVEQEDPEEVLAKAKKEAESIVNAAKAEADNFLSEARDTADKLYARQKEEGYKDGQNQSREETEQLRAQLEQDYRNKVDEYYAEYEREYNRLEPELVDAMIQVFDRVFGVAFEDKRPIIIHLVDNVMHGAETAKSFIIRVSEKNRSFLEEHLEELHANVPGDVEINIASDAGLGEEFCRIETENGVFDCSIDTELSNLLADIRLLCDQQLGGKEG